jgi:membrane associated rhomboid family serine protease
MALRVNIPPVTRILLISLLALSFLYNLSRWRLLDYTSGMPAATPIVPYLSLVPAQFVLYPWTLLTATFVEQNIVTVLLNAVTLFYGGKYLERAWGSREFGKFILIASLIPNVLTIPIYLVWGVVTANPERGYAPPRPGILEGRS